MADVPPVRQHQPFEGGALTDPEVSDLLREAPAPMGMLTDQELPTRNYSGGGSGAVPLLTDL